MMLWVLASAALAAPPSEGEVWTDFGAEVRVSKPVRLEAEQSVRVATAERRLEALTDIGARWKLSKSFDVESAWRTGRRRVDGVGEWVNRWNGDIKADTDAGPVELDGRFRYQIRLPSAIRRTEHVARLRLRTSLDLDGDIEPRLAAEGFLVTHDPYGGGPGIEKLRFDAGVRYGRKRYDLDLLYRHEEPVQDRADARLHIFAVKLTWELDLRKDD